MRFFVGWQEVAAKSAQSLDLLCVCVLLSIGGRYAASETPKELHLAAQGCRTRQVSSFLAIARKDREPLPSSSETEKRIPSEAAWLG
jgi:hypothetical protein